MITRILPSISHTSVGIRMTTWSWSFVCAQEYLSPTLKSSPTRQYFSSGLKSSHDCRRAVRIIMHLRIPVLYLLSAVACVSADDPKRTYDCCIEEDGALCYPIDPPNGVADSSSTSCCKFLGATADALCSLSPNTLAVSQFTKFHVL